MIFFVTADITEGYRIYSFFIDRLETSVISDDIESSIIWGYKLSTPVFYENRKCKWRQVTKTAEKYF